MPTPIIRNGTITLKVFAIPLTEKNLFSLISFQKIGNANSNIMANCGLQPIIRAIANEPNMRYILLSFLLSLAAIQKLSPIIPNIKDIIIGSEYIVP